MLAATPPQQAAAQQELGVARGGGAEQQGLREGGVVRLRVLSVGIVRVEEAAALRRGPPAWAARGAGTWAWFGVVGSGPGDSASGKDQGEGAESSVGLQRCGALCGAPPRFMPLESAVRPRQPTDGSDCCRPLATRHGEPHAAAPRRLLAVRRVHLVSLQAARRPSLLWRADSRQDDATGEK